MLKSENQLKEELFGKVQKLPATGGHQADPINMLALSKPVTGLHSFCTGCGTIVFIEEQGIAVLCRNAGIDLPDSYLNHYLQTDRCPACDENFKSPVIF